MESTDFQYIGAGVAREWYGKGDNRIINDDGNDNTNATKNELNTSKYVESCQNKETTTTTVVVSNGSSSSGGHGDGDNDQRIENVDISSNGLIVLNPPTRVEDCLSVYNDCKFRMEEKFIILPKSVRLKIESLLYEWIDKRPSHRILCSNDMGMALTIFAHSVHSTYLNWSKFLDLTYNDSRLLRLFRSYKTCIPEPGTLMGEIVAQFFQHCKQQSNLNVKRTMKKQHIEGQQQPPAYVNITPGLYNNDRKTCIDSKFEVIMSLKREPLVIIMLTAKQYRPIYAASGTDNMTDNSAISSEDILLAHLKGIILDDSDLNNNNIPSVGDENTSTKKTTATTVGFNNKIKRKIKIKTAKSITKKSLYGKNKNVTDENNNKNNNDNKEAHDKLCTDSELMRHSLEECRIRQFYNKVDSDVFVQVTLNRARFYDTVLDIFFKRLDNYNRTVIEEEEKEADKAVEKTKGQEKNILGILNVVFCSDTPYFMEISKRLFIDNSVTFLYCYLTDKYKPVIESRSDSDTFGLVKIVTCIEYCTRSSLKRNNNSKIGHGPLTAVISEGGLNESTKFVNNILRQRMLNPPMSDNGYDRTEHKKMFVINEPYINTFLNRPVDCGNMY